MNVNDKFNHLQINTCTHNNHKIKQIEPDENNEGIIFHICGFCRQEFNESIPIEENYIIEKLTANCQDGNGKRYISKKNMKLSYEKQII